MKLDLMSMDTGLVRIACEGEISGTDLDDGPDPLSTLLGPLVFSHTVLMSLERATYIDSRGIGWLVANQKRFAEGQGRLIVHSVPPRVAQVLQMVRLHMIMEIVADEAAARAQLAGVAS